MPRVSAALRSHRRNRLDNSGTTAAGGGKGRPGTPARRRSARDASGNACCQDGLARTSRYVAQLLERCIVCRRRGTNHQIHGSEIRKKLYPQQFAKAPLDAIALDRAVRMLRHHKPDPGVTTKGSEVPNLEHRGSYPLPCQPHCVKLRRSRQPSGARQAPTLRRRRTSTGA